jgi:hypothetical protein
VSHSLDSIHFSDKDSNGSSHRAEFVVNNIILPPNPLYDINQEALPTKMAKEGTRESQPISQNASSISNPIFESSSQGFERSPKNGFHADRFAKSPKFNVNKVVNLDRKDSIDEAEIN